MRASGKLYDNPEIISKPNGDEQDARYMSEYNSDGASESGSSGNEYEEDAFEKTKKFKQIIVDIKSKKFDWNDDTHVKNYLSQNESFVSKRCTKDMNLLHLIAAEDKEEMPPPNKMSNLIRALVRLEPNLLAQRDYEGKTPLFCAVDNRNRKLVRVMCKVHPDVSSVLKIPKSLTNSQSTNCLHLAISRKLSSKDDEFVKFLIERADADTLLAHNEDGLTPLQLAVEYKRCDEGQAEVVEALVARCDKALDRPYKHRERRLLSPYLYLAYTHEQAKRAERLDTENKRGWGNSNSREAALRNSLAGTDDILGKKGGVLKDEQRNASMIKAQISEPSRQAERPGEAPPGKFLSQPNMPDRGRGTVAVATDVNSNRKNSPKIPGGHERDRAVSKKSRSSKLKPTDASAERIKTFLKLYYLRNRKYDDAVEFLYGDEEEKQIYFDLVGINPKASNSRITDGLDHLGFEDVLQYVAIPRVEFEDDSVALGTSQRAKEPNSNSRTDMKSLFEWLRLKKGVKRILKVIVEDLQHPAHSDELIETCLSGMGVEIWDWKKFDLSPEVLHKVCPEVQVVHLYWGGNNAILRAWSEEKGLTELSNLEIVYLHTQQGLETWARIKKNVKEFKARIKARKPQIEVREIEIRDGKTDSNSRGLEAVRDPYEKHKWITTMEEFARFLHTAECNGGRDHQLALKHPITVAIIDDGVDINDQAMRWRIIGGRSFCPRDEEENLNQPYYISGGGHGTSMAGLVCKVCPNVKLFIFRVNEYFIEPGKRQITAKSAAEAVRAAIKRQVDIISMSWTIEKTDRNSADITELEDAISAAASQDILMFCAATDQGVYKDNTYPAATTSTKNIFKIGAAEASGAAGKSLGDQTFIDFILPGYQVVMEQHDGPRVKHHTALTGSSVATALASGLAAVILYTVQLADVSRKASNLRYQSLKKHDRMKEAFAQIGTKDKYIMVWNRFASEVQKVERELRPKDEWINHIETLADDLMRRA